MVDKAVLLSIYKNHFSSDMITLLPLPASF